MNWTTSTGTLIKTDTGLFRKGQKIYLRGEVQKFSGAHITDEYIHVPLYTFFFLMYIKWQ